MIAKGENVQNHIFCGSVGLANLDFQNAYKILKMLIMLTKLQGALPYMPRNCPNNFFRPAREQSFWLENIAAPNQLLIAGYAAVNMISIIVAIF